MRKEEIESHLEFFSDLFSQLSTRYPYLNGHKEQMETPFSASLLSDLIVPVIDASLQRARKMKYSKKHQLGLLSLFCKALIYRFSNSTRALSPDSRTDFLAIYDTVRSKGLLLLAQSNNEFFEIVMRKTFNVSRAALEEKEESASEGTPTHEEPAKEKKISDIVGLFRLSAEAMNEENLLKEFRRIERACRQPKEKNDVRGWSVSRELYTRTLYRSSGVPNSIEEVGLVFRLYRACRELAPPALRNGGVVGYLRDLEKEYLKLSVKMTTRKEGTRFKTKELLDLADRHGFMEIFCEMEKFVRETEEETRYKNSKESQRKTEEIIEKIKTAREMAVKYRTEREDLQNSFLDYLEMEEILNGKEGSGEEHELISESGAGTGRSGTVNASYESEKSEVSEDVSGNSTGTDGTRNRKDVTAELLREKHSLEKKLGDRSKKMVEEDIEKVFADLEEAWDGYFAYSESLRLGAFPMAAPEDEAEEVLQKSPEVVSAGVRIITEIGKVKKNKGENDPRCALTRVLLEDAHLKENSELDEEEEAKSGKEHEDLKRMFGGLKYAAFYSRNFPQRLKNLLSKEKHLYGHVKKLFDKEFTHTLAIEPERVHREMMYRDAYRELFRLANTKGLIEDLYNDTRKVDDFVEELKNIVVKKKVAEAKEKREIAIIAAKRKKNKNKIKKIFLKVKRFVTGLWDRTEKPTKEELAREWEIECTEKIRSSIFFTKHPSDKVSPGFLNVAKALTQVISTSTGGVFRLTPEGIKPTERYNQWINEEKDVDVMRALGNTEEQKALAIVFNRYIRGFNGGIVSEDLYIALKDRIHTQDKKEVDYGLGLLLLATMDANTLWLLKHVVYTVDEVSKHVGNNLMCYGDIVNMIAPNFLAKDVPMTMETPGAAIEIAHSILAAVRNISFMESTGVSDYMQVYR